MEGIIFSGDTKIRAIFPNERYHDELLYLILNLRINLSEGIYVRKLYN